MQLYQDPINVLRYTIPLFIVAFSAAIAIAENTEVSLGTIDFPNSGAAEAQADFIQGVLYLHNFEYEDASVSFKRAQEIAPDFALAYWGEALTYHQLLWQKQSRSSAVDVLRKIGRTPEDRAAKAPTLRE